MRCHEPMLTVILFLVPAVELSAQGLLERATFKGHTFHVSQMALSPDGKILATGGGDSRGGELKLWDLATGKEIAAFAGYSNSLYALAFSPDGKRLATGGTGPVQVWDASTHKELAAFKDLYDHASLVAFSPDGKKVAAAGGRAVKVWDLASGRDLVSFQHHIPVHGGPGLAISKDFMTLAARNYQEIDLWDVATGRQRATLSEHRGEVGYLAFSADGGTLVATSTCYSRRHFRWKGDVKLWDVATGKERVAFKGPFGRVVIAALSPDGKTLAMLDSPALHADPDLKLVDVATGQQRILRCVPAYSITFLAFTADGKLFVIGTPDDKTLTLWEVALSKGMGKVTAG